MRIVIDGTSLLGTSAGVKNYVYYWIQHLQQAAEPRSIEIFPWIGQLGNLNHRHSLFSRTGTISRLAAINFCNIRGNPALDLLHRRADIFHVSQHLVNPPSRPRLTATIYDFTCWRMPQTHTPQNVAATKAYAERILKKAHGCIAVSEQTRRDAIDILGLPPERVETIYPGIAAEFFDVQALSIKRVITEYRLEKPYILYVGMVEPRKNVEGLLNAYLALPDSLRKEHELVVAGLIGWCSAETKRMLTESRGGIRYIGYVPEKDLPGLTAGACIFAFPSFFEGFGFPVAQAMAAGVPVVTSRDSSLQEISSGAALHVNPYEIEEIRAALEKLLLAPELRAELGKAGRIRAAQYRWERSARQTLDFFRRMLQ